MAKHIHLQEREWLQIKDLLEKGRLTQRDIAYRFRRSDQTVRQVRQSESFDDYERKFKPSTHKKTPRPGWDFFKNGSLLDRHFDDPKEQPIHYTSEDITDLYTRTDIVAEGHLERLEKKLDRMEEDIQTIKDMFNAMDYIWEK